tara:strand:- start:609 stop:1055 length:447 start_codon:yes stop_codon:yes gene_type:complete
MSIFNTIKTDMYNAMKARKKVKSTALRIALSKIKDKQIEKRDPLNDDEIIKVLRGLVKQRDESIKLYNDAGRADLADNEKLEKKYLETYLPNMLSNEEVKIMVETVIKHLDVDSINDIGKIMPEVMKRGKGLVDGNFARQIVVSLLSK